MASVDLSLPATRSVLTRGRAVVADLTASGRSRLREGLHGIPDAGVATRVDETLAAFRAVAERRETARDAARAATALRILDRLERARVVTLVCGRRAATAVGARLESSSESLALLVSPSDLAMAEKVLDDLGCDERSSHRVHRQTGLRVEMAPQLPHPWSRQATDALMRGATRCRIGGVPVLVPNSTHQLLVAATGSAVSASRASYSELVQALADVQRPVDWTSTLRLARRLGVETEVCVGLTRSGVAPLSIGVDDAVRSVVEQTAGRTWPRNVENTANVEVTTPWQSTARRMIQLGRRECIHAASRVRGSLERRGSTLRAAARRSLTRVVPGVLHAAASARARFGAGERTAR